MWGRNSSRRFEAKLIYEEGAGEPGRNCINWRWGLNGNVQYTDNE